MALAEAVELAELPARVGDEPHEKDLGFAVARRRCWCACAPDVVEHKFYARDVGPVLRTDAKGGGRKELISFARG